MSCPGRSRVLVLLVFATKGRVPSPGVERRPDVCKYLSGTLIAVGCGPLAVNSMPDHVHLLFAMSRTLAICDAVEEVKKQSSIWAKSFAGPAFAWQTGYGAFGLSESNGARAGSHAFSDLVAVGAAAPADSLDPAFVEAQPPPGVD